MSQNASTTTRGCAQRTCALQPQLQLWEVYRYADIQTVLGDPHTYSSDASVLQTMATMDPPRHTQLRRLVARAFSAKLIADLEPRIVSIVDGLL